MLAEILKIEPLEREKVHYYTIWLDGRSKSEYDDFLTRMYMVAKYKLQLGLITQFIIEIGDYHGALPAQFKHERNAEALPPPYFIQPGDVNKYGLRLYCIRLSTEIVILLNGDLKTEKYAQNCPNCAKHFNLANIVARKIDEAIKDGTISLNGKEMSIDEDFMLDI